MESKTRPRRLAPPLPCFFRGRLALWEQVSVYDLTMATRVGVLTGHTGPVTTVECGDDWVLSGSSDSSIKLWQVQYICLCICVCVLCVFMKLRISTQSGPTVILLSHCILCVSVCVCVCVSSECRRWTALTYDIKYKVFSMLVLIVLFTVPLDYVRLSHLIIHDSLSRPTIHYPSSVLFLIFSYQYLLGRFVISHDSIVYFAEWR